MTQINVKRKWLIIFGWMAVGYICFALFRAVLILGDDSRALGMRGAVDAALGLDRYFPEKAIAPNLITAEMKRECLGMPRMASLIKQQPAIGEYLSLDICYGINFNAEKTPAYYLHCGFLWQEDCIALSISQPLFERRDLLVEVLKVLESPCAYLPTTDEIKQAFSPANSHPPKVSTDPGGVSHAQNRQFLSCDSGAPIRPTKVTIAVVDPQTSNYLTHLIVYRKEK